MSEDATLIIGRLQDGETVPCEACGQPLKLAGARHCPEYAECPQGHRLYYVRATEIPPPPDPEMEEDARLVGVKCLFGADEVVAGRLAKLRSVFGADLAVDNQQLLAQARGGGITVWGLPAWRAKEIAAALTQQGFVAEVICE